MGFVLYEPEKAKEEHARGYSKDFEDSLWTPKSAEWYDNERNLFGMAAVLADVLGLPLNDIPDFKYCEREELKKLGIGDGVTPWDVLDRAEKMLSGEEQEKEDELTKINREISRRMEEGVKKAEEAEKAKAKTRKEYNPARKKDRAKHRRK